MERGEGTPSWPSAEFKEILSAPRAQPSVSVSRRIETLAHKSDKEASLECSYLERARPKDLDQVLAIIEGFPDNAPDASRTGFLRARFSTEQYASLIDERHLWVAREGNSVVAFASALPWNHRLLSQERLVVGIDLGPLKIRLCTWIAQDYSSLVKSGQVIYIAEAAARPDISSAGAHLIKGFPRFRAEYKDSYLVATCSEAPIANLHIAQLVQRLGFQRIGYVRLPLRPFPAKDFPWVRFLSPFQSGIWLMKPVGDTALQTS
ncbi:MAG: hypothetical protein DCC75_07605 [Proteobacteria bacterium]|nr:MAG: hypothetical protein DCC75_07605 [Pseudomonadota bacterium]